MGGRSLGVAWGGEEGSYFLVLKDCTCRKRKCHTEIFSSCMFWSLFWGDLAIGLV